MKRRDLLRLILASPALRLTPIAAPVAAAPLSWEAYNALCRAYWAEMHRQHSIGLKRALLAALRQHDRLQAAGVDSSPEAT